MRDVSKQNREKLLRGLGAGAIATLLMTGLMFAAPALGGVPDAATRALAALRARPLLVVVALIIHFGYGGVDGPASASGARRCLPSSGLFFPSEVLRAA